jgi:hypothetical protein
MPERRQVDRRQVDRRAAGGRAMRSGTGIFLIAAGAVLRFAVVAGSPHGLNLHVVGIVLILAGVLGLALSLLARRGPRRPIRPADQDESRVGMRKRAAAANVAAIQEDDKAFSKDSPGHQNPVL